MDNNKLKCRYCSMRLAEQDLIVHEAKTHNDQLAIMILGKMKSIAHDAHLKEIRIDDIMNNDKLLKTIEDIHNNKKRDKDLV